MNDGAKQPGTPPDQSGSKGGGQRSPPRVLSGPWAAGPPAALLGPEAAAGPLAAVPVPLSGSPRTPALVGLGPASPPVSELDEPFPPAIERKDVPAGEFVDGSPSSSSDSDPCNGSDGGSDECWNFAASRARRVARRQRLERRADRQRRRAAVDRHSARGTPKAGDGHGTPPSGPGPQRDVARPSHVRPAGVPAAGHRRSAASVPTSPHASPRLGSAKDQGSYAAKVAAWRADSKLAAGAGAQAAGNYSGLVSAAHVRREQRGDSGSQRASPGPAAVAGPSSGLPHSAGAVAAPVAQPAPVVGAVANGQPAAAVTAAAGPAPRAVPSGPGAVSSASVWASPLGVILSGLGLGDVASQLAGNGPAAGANPSPALDSKHAAGSGSASAGVNGGGDVPLVPPNPVVPPADAPAGPAAPRAHGQQPEQPADAAGHEPRENTVPADDPAGAEPDVPLIDLGDELFQLPRDDAGPVFRIGVFADGRPVVEHKGSGPGSDAVTRVAAAGVSSGQTITLSIPFSLTERQAALCKCLWPCVSYEPTDAGLNPHAVAAIARLLAERSVLARAPRGGVIYDFCGNASRFGTRVRRSGRQYWANIPVHLAADVFRRAAADNAGLGNCDCDVGHCQHGPAATVVATHVVYYLSEEEFMRVVNRRRFFVMWHPDPDVEGRHDWYFGDMTVRLTNGVVYTSTGTVDSAYEHRVGKTGWLHFNGTVTNDGCRYAFRHTVIDPWTILTEGVPTHDPFPIRDVLGAARDRLKTVLEQSTGVPCERLSVRLSRHLVPTLSADPCTTFIEPVATDFRAKARGLVSNLNRFFHGRALRINEVDVHFYIPKAIVDKLRGQPIDAVMAASASYASALYRQHLSEHGGVAHFLARNIPVLDLFLRHRAAEFAALVEVDVAESDLQWSRVAIAFAALASTRLGLLGVPVFVVTAIVTYGSMSEAERRAVDALMPDPAQRDAFAELRKLWSGMARHVPSGVKAKQSYFSAVETVRANASVATATAWTTLTSFVGAKQPSLITLLKSTFAVGEPVFDLFKWCGRIRDGFYILNTFARCNGDEKRVEAAVEGVGYWMQDKGLVGPILEETLCATLKYFDVPWQVTRMAIGLAEGGLPQALSHLAFGPPSPLSLAHHVVYNGAVAANRALDIQDREAQGRGPEGNPDQYRDLFQLLIKWGKPGRKGNDVKTANDHLVAEPLPEATTDRSEFMSIGALVSYAPSILETKRNETGYENFRSCLRRRLWRELPDARCSVHFKEHYVPFLERCVVPRYRAWEQRVSSSTVQRLVASFQGNKLETYCQAIIDQGNNFMERARAVMNVFMKGETLPESWFAEVDVVSRLIFCQDPKHSAEFGTWIKGLEDALISIHDSKSNSWMCARASKTRIAARVMGNHLDGYATLTADGVTQDLHACVEHFQGAFLTYRMLLMECTRFKQLFDKYGQTVIILADWLAVCIIVQKMNTGRFDTWLTHSKFGVDYIAYKLWQFLGDDDEQFNQRYEDEVRTIHGGDDQTWQARPRFADWLSRNHEGAGWEWEVQTNIDASATSIGRFNPRHDFYSAYFDMDRNFRPTMAGKPFRHLIRGLTVNVKDASLLNLVGYHTFWAEAVASMAAGCEDVPVWRVLAPVAAAFREKSRIAVKTPGHEYSLTTGEPENIDCRVVFGVDTSLALTCARYRVEENDVLEFETALRDAFIGWSVGVAPAFTIAGGMTAIGCGVDTAWKEKRLEIAQIFRLVRPPRAPSIGQRRSQSAGAASPELDAQPVLLPPDSPDTSGSACESPRHGLGSGVQFSSAASASQPAPSPPVIDPPSLLPIPSSTSVASQFPPLPSASPSLPLPMPAGQDLIQGQWRRLNTSAAICLLRHEQTVTGLGHCGIHARIGGTNEKRATAQEPDLVLSLLTDSPAVKNFLRLFIALAGKRYTRVVYLGVGKRELSEWELALLSQSATVVDCYDEEAAPRIWNRGGCAITVHSHNAGMAQIPPAGSNCCVLSDACVAEGNSNPELDAMLTESLSRNLPTHWKSKKPPLGCSYYLLPCSRSRGTEVVVTNQVVTDVVVHDTKTTSVRAARASFEYQRSAVVPGQQHLRCQCYDCAMIASARATIPVAQQRAFDTWCAEHGWSLVYAPPRPEQVADHVTCVNLLYAQNRFRASSPGVQAVPDRLQRVTVPGPGTSFIRRYNDLEHTQALSQYLVAQGLVPQDLPDAKTVQSLVRPILRAPGAAAASRNARNDEKAQVSRSRQDKQHSAKQHSRQQHQSHQAFAPPRGGGAKRGGRGASRGRGSHSGRGASTANRQHQGPPSRGRSSKGGAAGPAGPPGLPARRQGHLRYILLALFVCSLLGLLILANSQMSNARNKGKAQASKAPAKVVVVGKGGNARRQAALRAPGKTRALAQSGGPRKAVTHLAEKLDGANALELENEVQAVEKKQARTATVPDLRDRETAGEHNATTWGMACQYPMLYHPTRFPDLCPFATEVGICTYDVDIPMVTTADGLYDTWAMTLIPQLWSPLGTITTMATISSIPGWNAVTGAYQPPNYAAIAANFGWYRITAASIEILNVAPTISQAGAAYIGCFPPGALSASVPQLASSPFSTLISESEVSSRIFASWVPVSEQAIDIGNSTTPTFVDVGLTYRPPSNTSVYDSVCIFFASIAHTATPVNTMKAHITLHFEAIPFTATSAMFNPQSVISSQDSTSAVMAAVATNSGKPAGTMNQEDSPGFLEQLAGTAAAAVSGIGGKVVDFAKDFFTDPSSAIDTVSQIVEEGAGLFSNFFGWLGEKDAYNRHLITVALGKDHLSPYAFLRPSRSMKFEDFNTVMAVPTMDFVKYVHDEKKSDDADIRESQRAALLAWAQLETQADTPRSSVSLGPSSTARPPLAISVRHFA